MLVMLIVIVFFLFINLGDWKTYGSFDWELFGTSLLGVVIFYGLFGLFVPRLIMKDSDKYISYEYAPQPITSFINKSGSELNGAFFLGCGGINGGSTDYYVAYAQFEKGDLRIKVDAYNTYINECDSIKPVIEDYWVKKKWLGYNSLWIWNSKPKIYEWQKNHGVKTVVVPTNTIYKEFNIKD